MSAAAARARSCAFALCVFAAAQAHALAEPAPVPETNLVQHVGEILPLDVALADEAGREVRLERFFGEVPVVLVFGYYRCPTLCTTLMEGVLLGVSATGLPPRSYRVLGVGIDARERAGDAAAKAAAYRALYDNVPLQLLTGRESETRRLARAAGVGYGYDTRFEQYSHPLAFVVVSPQGRIARYFPGVRFEPAEVRLALIEASAGRIGSLAERIYLRCAHYDAAAGRYNLAVMSMVRALCGVLVVALALWIWRRRRVS